MNLLVFLKSIGKQKPKHSRFSKTAKMLSAAVLTFCLLLGSMASGYISDVLAEEPSVTEAENLFGDIAGAPTSVAAPLELGIIFQSTVSGKITGVRVFGVTGETGEHTVRIWRNSDNSIVSGPHTFDFIGSDRWETFILPEPLEITPETEYTVSVSTGTDDNKLFAYITGGVAALGGNGKHLIWPANAAVYSVVIGSMPIARSGDNYMRDVVFEADEPSVPEDAEFFDSLNLDYPGLEQVKAAVDNADYETAKNELDRYLKNRKAPYIAPGYRIDDRPKISAGEENTGSGVYHTTLTVDWTGWKQVEIPFSAFEIEGDPIGWGKIDKISFMASEWGHTPTSNTTLIFDDIKISNGSEELLIADFEEGSQFEWMSPPTASKLTGILTERELVKGGSFAGKWTRHDIMDIVENIYIPHNWQPYDALKLWAYSTEATNAEVEIVLASEAHDATAANNVVSHKFNLNNMELQLPEDIDWTYLPDNGDVEWTYALNRHAFWLTLADAYWGTGDETYAQEWVDQFTDWYMERPVPPTNSGYSNVSWRTLEAGIRLPNFVAAWSKLRVSPALTADVHIMFLKSILDHGRYLLNYHGENNWFVTESVGLLAAAIMFPEFKEAEAWYNAGFERLEGELSNQLYPDGSHKELAMQYGMIIPMGYEGIIRMASHNEREIPQGLRQNMESAYNYFMYMIEPTLELPQTNDSDRIGALGIQTLLLPAANLYDRPDMLYAAWGGAIGEKPDNTSYSFDYAGHYVMRSDWTSDAMYLMVDAGPFGAGGHQHEDFFNIDLTAYGKPMLVDPGRYTYSGIWRHYFRQTNAHNTIMYDDKFQNRTASVSTYVTDSPMQNTWINSGNFDFFQGIYNYGYGTPVDKSINHERSIVFVKPGYWIVHDRLTGTGTHKYDLHWQLNGISSFTDPDTMRVSSTDEGQPNLHIIPTATEGLTQKVIMGQDEPNIKGWWSKTYGIKEPITQIIYTKRDQPAPAFFETVLYPVDTGITEVPEVVSLDVLQGQTSLSKTDASAVRVNTLDGSEDTVFISYIPRRETAFGGYKFDGSMAIVRKDSDDSVTSIL
jgi:hypothetical protein